VANGQSFVKKYVQEIRNEPFHRRMGL